MRVILACIRPGLRQLFYTSTTASGVHNMRVYTRSLQIESTLYIYKPILMVAARHSRHQCYLVSPSPSLHFWLSSSRGV